MNLSDPASVVLSTGDSQVLSVLTRTTRPMSGREISRLGGGNQSTTQRTLHRLRDHGLLHVQEAGAGAALLYVLNREHLAAEAVQMLVTMRRSLIDRLKSVFGCWEIPPVHASLFGSAARGDGGIGSDIDLFIVRPTDLCDEVTWTAQIEGLRRSVRAWTGNNAGISELTEAQVANWAEERPPIAEELTRDGVLLSGIPIHMLLTAAPQ